MTTIVISGHEIHSELDLHRTLARLLDFGPYYGRNLNALWDRLTTDIERPVHLVWEDAAESRQHIAQERFDKIVQLLKDVEARDSAADRPRRFTVEIVD